MVIWLSRTWRRLRARRGIGFSTVALLLAVSVLGNAACYHLFEASRESPPTVVDSLWYSLVSVTTIGYGDHFPVSLGGRVGAVVFVMIIGLSTFTVFLGMLIDAFMDFAQKGERGMGMARTQDHIVIVNFPGAVRVRQIIEELGHDPVQRHREIVVVSDQIERLPFSIEHVLFVNGSPLEAETYERANVKGAALALVLATSYADPSSDAVVASAVSVLDRANPSIYIVAECLAASHRQLFDAVRCNAVVPVLHIGSNLLVQELADPGTTQMVETITSNLLGETLYSLAVESVGGDGSAQVGYLELAQRLLERDINVVAVNRGARSMTAFKGVRAEPGDRVVYLAGQRYAWPELVSLTQSPGS